MVCYKRRNCPSRARNPGRPSSHSTGANSIRRHIRCSMCNSDPGDISITVWLLSKLSCRVRAWTPLALALKWAAAPCSRRLTVLRCFIPYYTLSPFFSAIPHVASSHLSLATGRKPEPLPCCHSERGGGSILIADVKWTAPLGHTMHNTGGLWGWKVMRREEHSCAHTWTPTHSHWHINTAVLHRCSSGLIHSWWIFTSWPCHV